MKTDRITDKRGLYAVTPQGMAPDALLAAVDQALAGGAVWLQYRAKPRPDLALARALARTCRRHDALFIVNDDPEVAAAAGADGVHLGRDDPDPARARRILGAGAVVGGSCYNDLERAESLAAAGADYLAFGSVRLSPTKPDAAACPLSVLGEARRLGLPVVAIGGITRDNAAEVIAAGADLVAVISDLFEAGDVRARAAEYAALFGCRLGSL